MRTAWIFSGLALGLLACGSDEADPGVQEALAPCESRGEVVGIQGRVVVPSCSTGVPGATVTVLDQLQFEIATVEADALGEFRVDASALPGDGSYLLRATSGPYTGPAQPAPFAVEASRSPYQIVKLSGAP